MINVPDSLLADELVSGIIELSSTEELILFVASREGMLPFCQRLIEQHDRGESNQLVRLTNTLCTARGALPGSLYEETRKVLLALNRFHDAGRNHYETLGLTPEASIDEVKKAYRTLSKKFHPDSSEQHDSGLEPFLEISGAYHAIMAASSHQEEANHRNSVWRKKRSDRSKYNARARKRFLFTVLALVAILAVASIFLAERHNRNIIINQLHTNATSPPTTPKTLHPDPQVSEAERRLRTVQTEPRTAGKRSEAETPNSEPQTVKSNRLTVEDILARIKPQTVYPEQSTVPAEPQHESEPVQSNIEESATNENEAKTPETESSSEQLDSKSEKTLTNTTKAVIHTEPQVSEAERRLRTSDSVLQTVPIEPQTAGKRSEAQTPNLEPISRKKTQKQQVAEPSVRKTENSILTDKRNEVETSADDLSKHEQRINTINTSLEIKSLVNEYTKLYNLKDLKPFLALFTDNATENGHEIATEIDQYKSLFAHAMEINLDINNISWQSNQNGYTAQGVFTSNYIYHNGSKREYNGNIRFTLVKELETLRIQALEYEFE